MTRDDWLMIQEILSVISNDGELKGQIGDQMDLIDETIDSSIAALNVHIATKGYTLTEKEKLLRKISQSYPEE